MNQPPPMPPQPGLPRPPQPSLTGQDSVRMQMQPVADALSSVIEVVQQSNNLALSTSIATSENAGRMSRQTRGLYVAGGVFLLISLGQGVSNCQQAGRIRAVTQQLEETTRLVSSLIASQDLTSRKIEGVGQQVQAVADEVPVLVLTDAGAGKPAKPSVVVRRPRTPQPTLVVPLELPKQEDAGAP